MPTCNNAVDFHVFGFWSHWESTLGVGYPLFPVSQIAAYTSKVCSRSARSLDMEALVISVTILVVMQK